MRWKRLYCDFGDHALSFPQSSAVSKALSAAFSAFLYDPNQMVRLNISLKMIFNNRDFFNLYMIIFYNANFNEKIW